MLRVLRNVFLSEPQIQNEQAAERVDDILNVCLLGVADPVMFDAIVRVEPNRIRASSWVPRTTAEAKERQISPKGGLPFLTAYGFRPMIGLCHDALGPVGCFAAFKIESWLRHPASAADRSR